VDAAVRIEKGGKPTVVIGTAPFTEEVISHSRMHGIPSLPFVMIDPAQHGLPYLPAAVEGLFDKLLRALTTPATELEKHIPGQIS
jgi:hypothetical protein